MYGILKKLKLKKFQVCVYVYMCMCTCHGSHMKVREQLVSPRERTQVLGVVASAFSHCGQLN